VDIKEKELEDLICANPHCILSDDAVILGRQIPLTHGRLDILAWDYGQTFIVELKAKPLQEKDVAQVLRYSNDVRWFLQIAFQNAVRQDQRWDLKTWRGGAYADRLMSFADGRPDILRAIQPVLIGSSADSSVLAAANGAGVEVQIWSINDENQVAFKSTREWDSLKMAQTSTPDWATRIVEQAQMLAWEQADDHIDQTITQLFKQAVNNDEQTDR